MFQSNAHKHTSTTEESLEEAETADMFTTVVAVASAAPLCGGLFSMLFLLVCVELFHAHQRFRRIFAFLMLGSSVLCLCQKNLTLFLFFFFNSFTVTARKKRSRTKTQLLCAAPPCARTYTQHAHKKLCFCLQLNFNSSFSSRNS